MKFLMVCLGNICRSPLAEGIMRAKIEDHALDWEVDSAGTSAYHAGELPDSRSIKVASEHGLDITNQRSRQILRADLDAFDVIYVMDSSNYNNVMDLCTSEEQRKKVALIMNMERPGWNEPVPDPYWGNDGFGLVYDMLDRACDAVVERYK